jgi:uncharacterized OB-fold protein
METTGFLPLVDYLILEDVPRLVVNECTQCGARFFDRRNACAACSGQAFRKADISREGVLRTFTIVEQAAPGVAVPFIAGIVDCEGTSVRASIVNVDPNPDLLQTGMRVSLTTYSLGVRDGIEAIGFGYEPLPINDAA